MKAISTMVVAFLKSVGSSFLLLSLFSIFPERREINLVNRIKPKKKTLKTGD